MGGPQSNNSPRELVELADEGRLWDNLRLVLASGFELRWTETPERRSAFAQVDFLTGIETAHPVEIGEVPRSIPRTVLRIRELLRGNPDFRSSFTHAVFHGDFFDLILAVEARSRGAEFVPEPRQAEEAKASSAP